MSISKVLPSVVLLSSLVFIVPSCIQPVDLDPAEPENALVVDGFITTDFGPHEINLSRLRRFAGTVGGNTIFPEEEATVFLTDQNGTRTDLFRREIIVKAVENVCLGPGPCCNPTPFFRPIPSFGYRTPETFRGEVGSTYTLTVITRAGRTYRSTPQTILPVPEIDSVSVDWQRLPSTDPLDFSSGVEISATWSDPGEERNFYSWRVNGIYKIETPDNGAECCLFDPTDGGATLCWINESNIEGNLLSFSDTQVNGSTVTQPIGFIQDDGKRFIGSGDPNRLYYVEVEQLGLSQEAFSFLRFIDSQLEIDGDLFDPPPGQIRGNMSNINDESELVLGFFGAYSLTKSSTFIPASLIEETQRSTVGCGDCRALAGAQIPVPEPFR